MLSPFAVPARSKRYADPPHREIEDIFLDLTQKFGFQRDSMRNMVHFCRRTRVTHSMLTAACSSIS